MIRFALWAAVSTKSQATKDKVSLDDQLADCRREAQRRGWTESAGPFVVPGQSRSRWINLSDAARAIPALDALIRSARRGEFDVLMCWDTTRFRSLLSPVHMFLEDQRVQLFSLAQPVEPVQPAQFDPRESDTAQILYDANAMASRLETKHKQRRWRSGMTGRVQSGLHFARKPYGYRKPAGREFDKKAVLEPDPKPARLLRDVKDRFLAGHSLVQLAERLNATNAPAPQGGRWSHTSLKFLLLNSFYAGYVTFGAVRSQQDRLSGRLMRLPGNPAHLVHLRGLHAPLWDEATRDRILAEFKRRGHGYSGRASYALSSLLRCSVCSSVMHAESRYDAHERIFWRCHPRGRTTSGHGRIGNSLALDRLAQALASAVKRMDKIDQPRAPDRRRELMAEQADLLGRRQRWMDAFESGQLSPDDFAERVHALDDQLGTVRRQLDDDREVENRRQHRRSTLEALAQVAADVPKYLRQGDPQEVNASLHEILEAVTVAPDRSLKLTWRR